MSYFRNDNDRNMLGKYDYCPKIHSALCAVWSSDRVIDVFFSLSLSLHVYHCLVWVAEDEMAVNSRVVSNSDCCNPWSTPVQCQSCSYTQSYSQGRILSHSYPLTARLLLYDHIQRLQKRNDTSIFKGLFLFDAVYHLGKKSWTCHYF